MSASSSSSSSSDAGSQAGAGGAAVAEESVWSALLQKASRTARQETGTLILMGDKRCGKSSLLHKFSDRSGSDSLSLPLSDAPARLVDYCRVGVRDRLAGRDADLRGQMHVWSIDEPAHTALLPTMIRSRAADEAGAGAQPSASAGASAPMPSASDLDHTVLAVAFDLSEPWRALDSVRSWLSALESTLGPVLASLPDGGRALRERVSRQVQGYYAAPSAADEDASGSPAPSSASSGSINPAIPARNLGLPLVFVGCKADAFARGLAGARASATAGVDEKLEWLTRALRRLALQYGAAVVYTSAAGGAVADRELLRASDRAGAGGVNIDTLQQYLFHRLFNLPLSHSDSSSSPDASSPSAGASSSGPFAPRAVVSADEYALFVPAGFDSEELIQTAARNAVAALPDSATPEEVFKGHAGSGAASRGARAGAGAAGAAAAPLLLAEDNATFFKQLKHAIEQGGGGSALAIAQGLSSMATAPSPAAAGSASSRAAPLVAPTARVGAAPASSPLSAGVGLPKPTPSPTPSGAASSAGAAGASATAAKGGQMAVKQFFRSLLNNNAKPEGDSKAAAAQKAVRANAEKELQRMTNESSAAAPPPAANGT